MRNLFFLILFLSHTGFAQESIVRLWQKGNKAVKTSEEEAIYFYQKAFDEAIKEKNVIWQANICADLCGSYHDQGNYQKAVDECLKGISILKVNRIQNDSTEFKLRSSIAACYKSVYNIKASFEQFEIANQIFHKHPELESQIALYVTFHYVNQGGCWYSLGDINRATFYYEKALVIAEKLPVKSDYSLILNKLSNIYKYRSQYNQASLVIEKAINNYKINGRTIYDFSLSNMYLSLGECYYKMGNYSIAISHIKKSKEIAIHNYSHPRAANLIPQIDISMANAYLKQNQIAQAKVIYQSVFNNKSSEFNEKNIKHQALKGLGEVAFSIKNYKLALEFIQASISEISGEKVNNLTNPFNLSSIQASLSFFSILNMKVDILIKLYEQNKDLKYLISAYETQKLSVDIAKKIRQNHETIESRTLFSHLFYGKYEKLIELGFQLNDKVQSDLYLQSGFSIMEEGKSIILSDNLSLQNSYRNSGSDSLVVKLKANQAYLAYLKGSSEKDIKAIKTYEVKVNQILEKLSMLNKSFVESFKSDNQIDLKSFQKNLNSKSAYLNYILINDQVYVTLVKKERVNLGKIRINSKELANHKNLLKTALTTNPGPYSGFKAKKSAAYFYNILIKPFEADLKGIDNLIINPDNEMIELSFDILVPHEKSNDYLIKKYNISYLNSALNYNDQIKNKFSRADQNWLSFAPFGSKTKNSNDINIQNLTILPSTIKEINGIKGQSIINEKSTKQTFVKTISELKDRVILIATHASENNGEPYLNFFPANDNYKLYANEIQYLDFKTPLVILGACESNAGKKMKGSGVLSIAKAFSIGGCPSVVGSLWEVHDESMAVLVSLFYKHLMRGERKDVALRLAKLEYLETETGLRNDPPYYWAHLQIIGDVSPLIIWPVILRYVMYGLMVIIISLSIIYGIRSRKRFFN